MAFCLCPVPLQRGKASLRKKAHEEEAEAGARATCLLQPRAAAAPPGLRSDRGGAFEQLVALGRKLGPVPTQGPVRHSSSPGEQVRAVVVLYE